MNILLSAFKLISKHACVIVNYQYSLNINSFALLWGPTNHLKHLLSAQRLPFTTAYFGSMFATLYFSMWVCIYSYILNYSKHLTQNWLAIRQLK